MGFDMESAQLRLYLASEEAGFPSPEPSLPSTGRIVAIIGKRRNTKDKSAPWRDTEDVSIRENGFEWRNYAFFSQQGFLPPHPPMT